jgi:hypothetical protein
MIACLFHSSPYEIDNDVDLSVPPFAYSCFSLSPSLITPFLSLSLKEQKAITVPSERYVPLCVV